MRFQCHCLTDFSNPCVLAQIGDRLANLHRGLELMRAAGIKTVWTSNLYEVSQSLPPETAVSIKPVCSLQFTRQAFKTSLKT